MHSPAPWKTKGLHIVDANGEWVAAGEWQGFMVPFVGENAMDNVAMAAVSPEMFELLVELLEGEKQDVSIFQFAIRGGVEADLEDWATRARAVIAKARRQPVPFDPSSITNRKN